MTACYIVIGLGTLAYFAVTDSLAAALGTVWVALFFCCMLAAAALICEKLEEPANRES